MDELQKLLAIEAIKGLKARYFRCVDTKDWEEFRELFVPDPVFDISDDVPGCVLRSRQAVVDSVSAGLAGCVSVHHGHCPEIELTTDTSARGIWAMEDMLRWEEGSGATVRSLHGYGHYVETYEFAAGQWFIRTLKLQRLRVDSTPWSA